MKRAWFDAIYSKNYKKIESLLPLYDDWRAANGNTGLMVAARMGSEGLAKLLLNHDAGKRNDAGETALIIATRSGNADIASLLVFVEAGVIDNRGYCALHWAIQMGNATLFNILLHYEQYILDEQGATMLMKAAWYSRPQFVLDLKARLLGRRDYTGDTALIYAILGGSSQVIEMLLEEVCLCNNYGSNGLMEAIKCSYGDHLIKLLSTEALQSLVGAKDQYGRTALMYAILYTAQDAAGVLVKFEEDIRDNQGDTAALLAKRLGVTNHFAIFANSNLSAKVPNPSVELTDLCDLTLIRQSDPAVSALNDPNWKSISVESASLLSEKSSDSHSSLDESGNGSSNTADQILFSSMAERSGSTSPVYGHEFNYLRRLQSKALEGKRSKVIKKAQKSKALTYRRVKALFNPRRRCHKLSSTKRKGPASKVASNRQASSWPTQRLSGSRTQYSAKRKRQKPQRHHKMIRKKEDISISFSTMDAPLHDVTESGHKEDAHERGLTKYGTLPSLCYPDEEQEVEGPPGVLMFSAQSCSKPPSVWTSVSKRKSVPLNEYRAKSYSKKYIKALITGNILQVRKLGKKEKDYGHYHGDTALMYAVRVNNPSLVRVLAPLEAGRLNPAGESALMVAARKNKLFAARFLAPYEAGYQDSCKYTALMHAAQHGNFSIVRLLAKKEAAMQNRTGETALMLATRYYYPEIMAFLSPFEGHIADSTGITPLMYMTLRNDRNMVRILAPHGSRQTTLKGTTALMMAVSRGYYECAGILHEAEAQMQDHRGRTALMIAAGCGNSELVRLMIGKEAGMKDAMGRRASDYARLNGYTNVVFFLHRWEPW